MRYTMEQPEDFAACEGLLRGKQLYSLRHSHELKSVTLRLLGETEQDMPVTVRFDGVHAYDMSSAALRDASSQIQGWRLLAGEERGLYASWTARTGLASEHALEVAVQLASGDVLRVLCRRITVEMRRFPCPCCGCLTYQVPAAEDSGYICPVCYWENDSFLDSDDAPSDCNHGLTLRQARASYRTLEASCERFLPCVRPPRQDEKP